jgi:hypothetical protein
LSRKNSSALSWSLTGTITVPTWVMRVLLAVSVISILLFVGFSKGSPTKTAGRGEAHQRSPIDSSGNFAPVAVKV